jgi:TolA-binding protein
MEVRGSRDVDIPPGGLVWSECGRQEEKAQSYDAATTQPAGVWIPHSGMIRVRSADVGPGQLPVARPSILSDHLLTSRLSPHLQSSTLQPSFDMSSSGPASATSSDHGPLRLDTAPMPSPLVSRPTSSAGGLTPSTPGIGPMHRTWEPPPRAKPGRKPMNDNPIDKRKTQNRASQRAFRERKAEQIRKAETDVRDMKLENNELRQQVHQLQERYSLLEGQAAPLQSRIQEQDRELALLRQELKDTQHRLATVDAARSVEPHPIQEPVAFSQNLPVSPPASLSMSGGGCGRCNDSGRCPCVDDYIQDDIPPNSSVRSPSPVSRAPAPVDFTSFGKETSSQKPSGPGTCAKCQADPNQRKWCMTLAKESKTGQDQSVNQTKSPATRSSHRKVASIPNDLDSRQYVRCSEAYPILRKSGKDSNDLQDSTWMRTVMTRSSPQSDEGHSPMEVEMASALTSLSRQTLR